MTYFSIHRVSHCFVIDDGKFKVSTNSGKIFLNSTTILELQCIKRQISKTQLVSRIIIISIISPHFDTNENAEGRWNILNRCKNLSYSISRTLFL